MDNREPSDQRAVPVPEMALPDNNSAFDFEDAFDDYMRKVAQSVPEHAVQYRESRRAFIAGARRIFVYMTQGVVQLSDDDAEKKLQRLDKELCVYWERACKDKD